MADASLGSPNALVKVSGLIERVTYFNEETGFAVLRVKAAGHRDLVTVVGSLPSASAGEWATAEGTWVRDKEHGLQLKATVLRTVPPTTTEGIEKYLGSGMVKGIGPVFAKRMVERFGADILAVIEHRSGELETVEGIGPKRRHRIKQAWEEGKQVREIMLFLHGHGVSTSKAVRIYKTYGDQAIGKVKNNPYVLAKDIYGIGFRTADQIAQNVGIPKDSLNRASAGIDHVLLEATTEGHCALPVVQLTASAVKLLAVGHGTVEQALSQMITSGALLLEIIRGESLVFLPHLRKAEEGIAGKIRAFWSRRRQDDLGEFDPDDSPGQGREMLAVCAHRQGGEAPVRGHRHEGENHPPPSGGAASHRPIRPQRVQPAR